MATTIICGTNRTGSLSLKIARLYHRLLAEAGTVVNLVDLMDLPDAVAFQDLYGGRTDEFVPFQELVHQTDRFIFIVPEYNGSLPGILKIFIDACDYPNSFSNKSAALVGLSAGERGNAIGLNHLEDILTYLGTAVLPEKVVIGRIRQYLDAQGELKEDKIRAFLSSQLEAIMS